MRLSIGSQACGALLLALVIAAAVAVAPRAQGVEQTPRFRADSAAVLVDVVVRDRDHHPIVGLRQQDFEVFEDGKRQALTYFEAIVPPPAMAPPTTAGDQTQPAMHPGAGESATRLSSATIALAFEQLSPEGRQLATAAARRFVTESLNPDDVVSIVAIDRALHVFVPYTTTSANLLRGIDQMEQRAGHPLEVAGSIAGAEWAAGQTASHATQTDSPYIRAHATVDALRGLMATMHHAQGRRVIILFSEGLALGASKDETASVTGHDTWLDDNRFDAMDRLAKEAGRDGVTFYTFDARGLRPSRDPMGFGEAAYVGLKFLADETGGTFVDATNDLGRGILRIGVDLHSYYLLGYTSPKPIDHRYRQLKVKVGRQGVTVLARRGYMADGRQP